MTTVPPSTPVTEALAQARLAAEGHRLEHAAARPSMGWRIYYHAQWPRVKNLVPHNSIYSYARMQDVWLDR